VKGATFNGAAGTGVLVITGNVTGNILVGAAGVGTLEVGVGISDFGDGPGDTGTSDLGDGAMDFTVGATDLTVGATDIMMGFAVYGAAV